MSDGERATALGASEGEGRTAGPAGPVARSIEPLSAQEKRRLLAQPILQHKGEPKRYPASFAQQRLWFLDQVAPGKRVLQRRLRLRLLGAAAGGRLEQR